MSSLELGDDDVTVKLLPGAPETDVWMAARPGKLLRIAFSELFGPLPAVFAARRVAPPQCASHGNQGGRNCLGETFEWKVDSVLAG